MRWLDIDICISNDPKCASEETFYFALKKYDSVNFNLQLKSIPFPQNMGKWKIVRMFVHMTDSDPLHT